MSTPLDRMPLSILASVIYASKPPKRNTPTSIVRSIIIIVIISDRFEASE